MSKSDKSVISKLLVLVVDSQEKTCITRWGLEMVRGFYGRKFRSQTSDSMDR